ncbi:hypothetical protein HHI36_006086, partial [Cryptolaemus montrouzieri]
MNESTTGTTTAITNEDHLNFEIDDFEKVLRTPIKKTSDEATVSTNFLMMQSTSVPTEKKLRETEVRRKEEEKATNSSRVKLKTAQKLTDKKPKTDRKKAKMTDHDTSTEEEKWQDFPPH